MKKAILNSSIALIISSSSAQAVTFNFDNSITAGVQGADFSYACNTSNMDAGKEMRMCDPEGNLGGGFAFQKDTINGSEQWMFSDGVTGLMTGVANTSATNGLTSPYASYIDLGYVEGSADRNGGPALDQGTPFFGETISFLAPTLGSDAITGAAHANDVAIAAGVYTATSMSTFEIFFATLESQWAGTHMSLGRDSGGVTFYGTTDGTNFSMWAEEVIDATEDNFSVGFAAWSFEWYYVGTIDGFEAPSAVPIPAAIWLFGSGLLGLIGFAKRKKA